jgi:hypothetical protein
VSVVIAASSRKGLRNEGSTAVVPVQAHVIPAQAHVIPAQQHVIRAQQHVIPAQAGIQVCTQPGKAERTWVPAYAGTT